MTSNNSFGGASLPPWSLRTFSSAATSESAWTDTAGKIIFIERLWKTVKYEEVYLKAYESITHARKELNKFFDRYNIRRPHQGLDEMTPDEVYWRMLPKAKDAA